MSRYAINTLLYQLKKDRELRARFIKDPRAAIADADLTDAERAAFIAGDMKKITSSADTSTWSCRCRRSERTAGIDRTRRAGDERWSSGPSSSRRRPDVG